MSLLNIYDVKVVPCRNHFFKYIIYVHHDGDTVTVEDCNTGKIITTNTWDLNRFIENINVEPRVTMLITGTNFVVCGSSTSQNTDNFDETIYESSKTNVFQYLTSIPYVSIEYNVVSEINNEIEIPQDDIFVPHTTTLTCRVPYLPTFAWWNSSTNRWRRLMFYYKSEFYIFPYGNVTTTSPEGWICSHNGHERSPLKFITGFNASGFNLDLGLGFRCDVNTKAENMITFDIDKIEEMLIDGSQALHLWNVMYYMSHKQPAEIPWDKILLKAPISWFDSSKLIKDKCLKLAESLTEY